MKNRLNCRKINIFEKEEDYDKARFFAEDVQSILADCGVDMEISYEKAGETIRQWYYFWRLLWI